MVSMKEARKTLVYLLNQLNKETLLGFRDDYFGVLNGDNVADILKAAKEKKRQ